MNNLIEKSISEAVDELIENSTSNKKLKSLLEKHSNKIHFIPVKYRILGGILQSMNIQFGNFLETTIKNIIEQDKNNEIIYKYSGKKSNKFFLKKKTINLIDNYILNCQTTTQTETELEISYVNLLEKIVANENQQIETELFAQDIDLLFRQKIENRYVYVEIKYNDDHDTGKFIDINRKFLKTYALLVNELGIKNTSDLKPVLMYFNNKKMKGNIYIPENVAIYRGQKFFDTFSKTSYYEIDNCFKNISESDLLIQKFNELYMKIINEPEYII